MIPNNYLELGLIALGRGGQLRWFNGHFGAALLAAYYMNKENDLPAHVQAGLKRTCDAYIEHYPDWFAPLENEAADPALMAHVFDWLRINLAHLRSSGHGLALGVLGLKALLERPDLCTPSIIDGYCKTLENTSQDRENRYYGIANYFEVTSDDVQGIPVYESSADMIQQAFDALDFVAPNMYVGEQHYFFTGEPEHGVTHAQALVELERLGYPELAAQGLVNHRIQIYLNNQHPAEIEPQQIVDPGLTSLFDETYWAKTFADPHAIKVPYAALSLLKQLPEAKRARAEFGVLKLICQAK